MRVFLIFVAFCAMAFAQGMFQSVPANQATIKQAGEGKNWCLNCGMNLAQFYKTNHAVTLKNGEVRQFCSIHCLVDELEFGVLKGKEVAKIEAVDTINHNFISAKTAHYVVGSSVKGTMSMVSKYAFATKKDAVDFQSKNGGNITNFDGAYKKALEDFAQDMQMIRSNRATKAYENGKQIYQKSCDQTKLAKLHFHTIGELKSQIRSEKACGELNEMQLQMVSLYFADIVQNQKELEKGKKITEKLCENLNIDEFAARAEIEKELDIKCKKLNGKNRELAYNYLISKAFIADQTTNSLVVPDGAKCPVCGMLVSKYPKWAAKQVYDGGELYFDGAKDFFKYLLEPDRYKHKLGKPTKLIVTDYYTTNAVDATKAFFVIGSDVYGPMGNELVPFANESDAKEFSADHHGKGILRFDEITTKTLKELE